MKKISYIATIIDKNYVEVCLCDTLPDFVHAVKYDHSNNVEIYFSADVDWTPELETRALEGILDRCVYDTNAIAV